MSKFLLSLLVLASTSAWGGNVQDLSIDQQGRLRVSTRGRSTPTPAISVDTATPTTPGSVKTYVPAPSSAIKTLSSAGYTVLDTDGYDTIEATTGGSNQTVTLPTLANNLGRKITLKKIDGGAGFLYLDGAGSETIDGSTSATTYGAPKQNNTVTVVAASAGWVVVSSSSPTPATSMTDAEATMLGRKTYSHGTTYNGGNAPTLTVSGLTLAFVQLTKFIPYQTQSGVWRLRGNYRFSTTGGGTSCTMLINSVTGSAIEAQTFFNSGVGTLPYSGTGFFDAPGNFSLYASSSTLWSGHFDVELGAKPNWAY